MYSILLVNLGRKNTLPESRSKTITVRVEQCNTFLGIRARRYKNNSPSFFRFDELLLVAKRPI